MRNVWDRYDSEESGSKVFSTLVAAVKRLVTEKPALLGSNQQIHGVGVANPSDSGSGYGLDVGGVAGMVATAASASLHGVVGMMGSEAGLSVQGSAMKLQWFASYYYTKVITFPFLFIFDFIVALTNWTKPTPHLSQTHTSISSVYNAWYLFATALPLLLVLCTTRS